MSYTCTKSIHRRFSQKTVTSYRTPLVASEVLNHRRGVGGTHLACVASVSNRVIARKLEQEQKKRWSFLFFALVPAFLDELARKRLLRGLELIREQVPTENLFHAISKFRIRVVPQVSCCY